jgi:hypothetical protein
MLPPCHCQPDHPCTSACRCGLAVNTAGGTHHDHPDFGSGFCLVNDLAMTVKVSCSGDGVLHGRDSCRVLVKVTEASASKASSSHPA